MNHAQIISLTIGVALEVAGLGTAAWDLSRTWRKNRAPDERLLPRICRPLVSAATRILQRRQPEPIPVSGTVVLTSDASLSAVGLRPLVASDPLEDQVAQVKREVDEARVTAIRAQETGDSNTGAIAELHEELRKQIAAVRSEAEANQRRSAADSVPPAVVGLGLAAIGTIVQYSSVFLS